MLSDLRFAFRQLAKAPGYCATVIATLALSIGACTAIYSVVDGVLLRPLPYPNAERIHHFGYITPPPHQPGAWASSFDYYVWAQELTAYDCIAASVTTDLNLAREGEPQRLPGLRVTSRYFEVFGVKPVLGRTFLPEDDTPGTGRVVVIGHGFWQREFAGAPDTIGRALSIHGEPHTIIGVAPRSFGENMPGFGDWRDHRAEAWVPMAFPPSAKGRKTLDYAVIGRAKMGVSVAAARAELEVLTTRLARENPRTHVGLGVLVMRLQDAAVREVRVALWMLFGAVGCVVLIACANIANLSLANATARHREISIRAALGASGARLARQVLTENMLLAVLGGGAGLLIAFWGIDALVALAPTQLPRAADIRLDRSVLAFAFALSTATGLAFGLLPAWFAARTHAMEALKQGGRNATETRLHRRMRHGLMVCEVGCAVVLLAGAGFFIRSFAQLAHADPGFKSNDALLMRVALLSPRYAQPSDRTAFADALVSRLRAIPGVQAAAVSNALPLREDLVARAIFQDRPDATPEQTPPLHAYGVSTDYFRAMGIPLIRGRTFTDYDHAQAPRVAVINESFARRHFPNEDPIGKRIHISGSGDRPLQPDWKEIVGIVGDTTHYGVDQMTPNQAYNPYPQGNMHVWPLNIVVRTAGLVTALHSMAKAQLYAVDPTQPIKEILALDDVLHGSRSRQRFTMRLLTAFSAVALFLAAMGIYGVIAFSVSRRTTEIGIRMALGAQPVDVMRLVMMQCGRPIGVGVMLGIGGTFAAGPIIESMLYQTSPSDPLILAAIIVLLTGVAALAAWIPARRATKVDPIIALRGD